MAGWPKLWAQLERGIISAISALYMCKISFNRHNEQGVWSMLIIIVSCLSLLSFTCISWVNERRIWPRGGSCWLSHTRLQFKVIQKNQHRMHIIEINQTSLSPLVFIHMSLLLFYNFLCQKKHESLSLAHKWLLHSEFWLLKINFQTALFTLGLDHSIRTQSKAFLSEAALRRRHALLSRLPEVLLWCFTSPHQHQWLDLLSMPAATAPPISSILHDNDHTRLACWWEEAAWDCHHDDVRGNGNQEKQKARKSTVEQVLIRMNSE